MLRTVTLRSHLQADIDLIVAIVPIAESVVQEQVRTCVLSIEEHDLIAFLDGFARLIDQAEVRVILMVNVLHPEQIAIFSWHGFLFGLGRLGLSRFELVNEVTQRVAILTLALRLACFLRCGPGFGFLFFFLLLLVNLFQLF